MISAIKLTGFKKHRSAEFSFQPGLNVIRGANAQGKTTVLRGVLFALFGPAAAGAKEHLKSRGEKKMEVVVEMALPEVGEVVITRSERAAKVEDKDGNVLAQGISPTNAFLAEKLGMDMNVFQLLATSPQGEAANLLTLGATKLQKQVESIAGLDVIDKIQALISEDVSNITGRVQGMGEAIDVAVLEQQLSDYNGEYSRGMTKQATLTARWEWFNESISQRKKTLHEQAELEAKLNQLITRENAAHESLEKNTAEWEQLKAQLAELNVPDDIGDRMVALNNSICMWHELEYYLPYQISTKKGSKEQLKKERDTLAGLKEMKKVSYAAVKQWEKAAKAAAPFQEKYDQLEQAERQALLELQSVESSLGNTECPTCGREFEEGAKKKLLATKKALSHKYDEARKVAAECKKVVEANQKELDAIAEDIIEDIDERIAEQEEYIKSLTEEPAADWRREDKFEEARATIGKLSDEKALEFARDKVAALRTEERELAAHSLAAKQIRKQCVRFEQEVASGQKTLDILTAEIDALPQPMDEAELVEMQSTLIELEQDFGECNKARGDTQADLARLDTLIKTVMQNVTQAKKQNQLIKQTQDQLTLLQQLQTYLRKNRTRLASEIWDGILGLASSFIDSVTEGVLRNLTRDEGGAFYVTEDDSVVPVSELSGAQRAITSTCLRLAISRVFHGPLGFMLMDEISADMDDDNAAAMAGLLASTGAQILAVTHRQGDQMLAGNLIELAA